VHTIFSVTASVRYICDILQLTERTPRHSSGVSLAIWDHIVLPATQHKWTHPALTPARQVGTWFTNA